MLKKKKNHTQRYKTKKKNSINAYLWRAVINSDNIYLRFSLLNYAVYSVHDKSSHVFVHLTRSQQHHSEFIHGTEAGRHPRLVFHMSYGAYCLHAVQKGKQKILTSTPTSEQVIQSHCKLKCCQVFPKFLTRRTFDATLSIIIVISIEFILFFPHPIFFLAMIG